MPQIIHLDLDTCKGRKRFDPTRENALKITGPLSYVYGCSDVQIPGYLQTHPKTPHLNHHIQFCCHLTADNVLVNSGESGNGNVVRNA